jgi:hypothetical protein
MRSMGTVTLNSGKTITASAGNGAPNESGPAGGGGGGGGYVRLRGTTVTNNGTITVSGGTGPLYNGTTGVVDIQNMVWGTRQ